ncbi:MAG: hypothetical protein ABI678_31505 [Kofleriaceae bacterium]
MRLLIAIVLVARTVSAEPPRRKVHIDHVAPAKVGQFEQARKDWVAWTREHHVVDPWGGTFLQVGGATFYTMRAFTDWAELDVKSSAKLDPKAQAAYNERSDDALVPPHHNEIWVREPALDLPGDVAGYGKITFDEVVLAGDAYEKAWIQIRTELAAAKYPIARIAFFSAYGSGRHISLWLAPTKAAFTAAPSIDEVLAKRLGKAKAAALLARWRGVVIAHEELELVVRSDLSN